jgi:hypothetical protein
MDRELQEQPLQCWAEVGIHPLAIGHDRSKPATRRVADGEKMNPKGECAFAQMQETTSTRAMSTARHSQSSSVACEDDPRGSGQWWVQDRQIIHHVR